MVVARDLAVVEDIPTDDTAEPFLEDDLATFYSELDSEDDEDEDAQKKAIAAQGSLAACVSSNSFQYSVGFIILANTVAMAIQVDHRDWEGWSQIEDTFLLFFVTELVLRIYVYGTNFFCDQREWPWNVFDFTIVLLGVFDYCVRLFDIKHAKVAKLVTVLRTVRVLRILRLLRVIKVFRALYSITITLFSSLKSVFWVTVMFSIVIVVSAIFTTVMIGKTPEEYSDPKIVETSFGSVPASMSTLFQFVTLDDWSSVSRVIVDTYPLMQVFFCAYIFLTSFTMLSVLTGMVTQHTERFSRSEDEKIEKKFLTFIKHAEKIFNHCDRNSDGTMNCEEFLEMFHEKDIHKMLYVHGIDIDEHFEDGRGLFACMDHQSNGEINVSEFRDGLQRMRGNAKAKDFFRMQSMIRKVEDELDNLGFPHSAEADTALVHRRLDFIIGNATTLLRRMENMEEEFEKFAKTMPHSEKKATASSCPVDKFTG